MVPLRVMAVEIVCLGVVLMSANADVSAASATQAAPTTTAPSARLLPDGQVERELVAYLLRRVPGFTLPTDVAAWERRRDELRQRVLREVVFRGVPASWSGGDTPFEFLDGAISGQDYVIRKLRYRVVPGLWVGALLYEPTSLTGPAPGVLNVNGHERAGMAADYKQTRCINLARRGMVALSLEWIGMGQLQTAGWEHDHLAYLDLCGRSGLSIFYLSLQRGLDVLLSHRAVDPRRVAVTGLSGGGWQTIMIASLDERVRLAAPNAGYTGLSDRVRHLGDAGDLEQSPTDLSAIADYVHLTAFMAPRPTLLIYNARDDCCFVAERARGSVFEPIVPLYALYGQGHRFALHVNEDPGTHNYGRDNREAFYRFLHQHFEPQADWSDQEIPVADEIRQPEALAIEYPAGNADFLTLAAEAMETLPRQPRPRADSSTMDRWRREVRPLLHAVVRPRPGLMVEATPVTALLPDRIPGTSCQAWRIRLDATWTLPIVVHTPVQSVPTRTTLILADEGHVTARELVERVVARGERCVTVDLLLTGECRPTVRPFRYAQLISTVGERSLGIQVSQLWSVIDWIEGKYPDQVVSIVARGRVAGLAALVAAALAPERVTGLHLDGLDASLKDLLTRRIGYRDAPSMFCFGLLELVDVPELCELAAPTSVGWADAFRSESSRGGSGEGGAGNP